MDESVRLLPLNEQPVWRASYLTQECNVMELLAAVIGGRRPIETASAVVEKFGSLQEIANATAEELAAVPGVGQARTAAVKAAVEFGRRMISVHQDPGTTISSPEDAANLLLYKLGQLEQEHLYVLLLSTRNNLIGEPVEVYHGSLNSSWVRIGEVLRPAIRANAAAIIIAHNHPSGDPMPSPEDVAVTKAIVKAGELVDVEVLDHLVIGRGRYVSLKSKGLGF